MRNDLTDITMVLDRSGSMQMCRSDAEGGVNAFIKDQQNKDGECLLTIVQFDTEYEFICKGVNINNAPEYKLHPRGSTALLDAVGRAINETGERLDKMDEQDRPGLVVFVIVTDGQENSSREFDQKQVKELIDRQQNNYNWQFTYLSADINAFADAGNIGLNQGTVAVFNTQNVGATYKAAASNVSRMRSSLKAGEAVRSSYTEEERKKMASTKE